MNFVTSPGPYLRDAKASNAMKMLIYTIALGVIWMTSMVYYDVVIGVEYSLAIFTIMMTAQLTTLLADMLVAVLRYQPSNGRMLPFVLEQTKKNYSYVTATLFALIIPVGTPAFVVIMGSLFSTLVVKYTFGGFGANIFNPAALGRIFVGLAFGSTLLPYLPGDSSLMIPTLTTGATITTALNNSGWLVDSLNGFNVTLNQLLLGTYTGAIGETFSILILVIGISLSFFKVHNWRPTIFFYGTIFFTTLAMGSMAGINPWMFSLIFMSSGSIIFGGSFMLTDPVTSPTSNFGKALIGILAGIFVVFIRFQSNNPEGVAYAIVFVNMLSPLIDKFTVGSITQHMQRKWGIFAGLVASSMVFHGGLVYAAQPSTSSSLPDIIEPYRVLNGTATSLNCSFEDPDCLEAEEDTIATTIDLNEYYQITNIDVTGKVATNGFWKTTWNANIDDILASYQALSINGIQQLDTLSALPDDLALIGATNSAERLMDALLDAVKTIDVYEGSFTSDIPDDPEAILYTMNVKVYVENGMIMTFDITNPEDIATSAFYRNNWNEGFEALLETYRGYTVEDFLALEDFPSDLSILGATVSAERLFYAIQDALVNGGQA